MCHDHPIQFVCPEASWAPVCVCRSTELERVRVVAASRALVLVDR